MKFLKNLFKSKPKIYCDRKAECAAKAFKLQELPLNHDANKAEMLWIRKGYRALMPLLAPNQLINHFPNEGAVINKGYLTQTLKAYQELGEDKEVSIDDLYPESYCLYEPEDRKRFFDQLPKVDSRDNIWIYKPGNNSRGRGIEIMWRTGKLRKKYGNLKDQFISSKDEQGIIQRYIKNPMLLNERKSEIRVYWLLASLNPLRVLLFDEGTVRLNSLPYQLDQFDNQLIHVTNVYQQYKHPDFDPSVVLKWSFAELDRYLLAQKKVTDEHFTKNILMPKLKKYLAFVAKAGRKGFNKKYPEQGECFGVYGADVILDDQLNPNISEIQKGPGLSFSDPIKKNIIPPMLGEAARIMFEIREARINNKPLPDLKNRDRYQWVINEAANL
ncbi:MAG: hypothetical protein QM496_08630 [Verrucomicrobiota bacterium]